MKDYIISYLYQNQPTQYYIIIYQMDKIWNPQAWPKPTFSNIPTYQYIKSLNFNLTHYSFQSKFIDYLINICNEKQAHVQILQLSLSIASRYMSKNTLFSQPTQIVLLTSLFLAGKVLGNSDGTSGGFTINQLHKFSNHCFTNKDFYRIEKKILQQLDFDILREGICDKKVKGILLMIRQIIQPKQYNIICKVSEDVQVILWQYIYTKGQKQKFLKKCDSPHNQTNMENLIIASIIQVSFVLCTQCVGRFPATVWIIHILNLKQDQLSLYVQDVLKIVLGRQKFQELKI